MKTSLLEALTRAALDVLEEKMKMLVAERDRLTKRVEELEEENKRLRGK